MTNAPTRRRMTRKEIWTHMGASFAGWVMFVALVRIWWRVYLVSDRLLN